MIFLDRFDLLKIVSLKLAPDGIKFFLFVSLHIK